MYIDIVHRFKTLFFLLPYLQDKMLQDTKQLKVAIGKKAGKKNAKLLAAHKGMHGASPSSDKKREIDATCRRWHDDRLAKVR